MSSSSTSAPSSRRHSNIDRLNAGSPVDPYAAYDEIARLHAYYAPLLLACPDMAPSPYPSEAYRPFKAMSTHTIGVARREEKRASSTTPRDKQTGPLDMWADFTAAIDDTVPPTSPPSHAVCTTISLPDVEPESSLSDSESMEDDDVPELDWSPTSSLAPTRPNTPSSIAADLLPDLFAAALEKVLVEDVDGVPAFGIGVAVYGDEYAVESIDTDPKELDPLDELMGLAVV
ncbi:hypothetical protein PsYK624_135340 [Phanerochaete sordida]|uniref:Uncharacterized protein n=1 Tax=Phanerochaete sordida TaxID=48140 RepID=A0A9P3LJH1_9APHY|nr:hypothetical protein PsYK624_135340 [Phanerochaete sordida]